MRAVWGVRDGARIHGVADRVSGSCDGGPIWSAPSNSSAAVVGEPRRNGDGRGTQVLSSVRQRVQRLGGEGERGQGGLGSAGPAGSGMATRRRVGARERGRG